MNGVLAGYSTGNVKRGFFALHFSVWWRIRELYFGKF